MKSEKSESEEWVKSEKSEVKSENYYTREQNMTNQWSLSVICCHPVFYHLR